MKKFLVLILGLTTLLSCSNDELLTDNQETGNVVAIVNQAVASKSTSATASKDVNRGNIYAWVSDVTIEFKHVASGIEVSENFQLVNSGGEPNFNVENVLLGDNEITAYTGTDSNEILNIGFETPDNNTQLTRQFDYFKGLNPYVLYQSTPFTQEINSGTNVTNINLNTNHGRRISAFKFKDNIGINGNYFARVTQYDVNNNVVAQTVLRKNHAIYSYWSDNTALDGNSVNVKVELFSHNGSLLKTYNQPLTIQASKSISCIYVIDLEQIVEDVQGINLIFQEWEEVHCDDC